MEHLFLINPQAGRTDPTAGITAAAKALCSKLKEPFDLIVSQHPGHLTEVARKAGQSGRPLRLYACGGDGTLNEVVSGAVGWENLSVTCIPCGSGNDYIKQFPHPEAFCDWNGFAAPETRQVDLISAGTHYAVNVCSVGFDARIGTSINAFRHLPLLSGPRAYQASVVVNLIKGIAKPCRVELEDGTVADGDLTMVCVCNGSWYGGSFHSVPEASISDGLLDVLVVKQVSRLTVARVIRAYQKGQYADYPELISHHRVRSLRITTPQPEPVNLDGELIFSNDLAIEVLPSALRFFAPAKAWQP